MIKFEIDDRVITVENGAVRHGVITQTFECIPVVIVKFDDGEVEKVNPFHLAIEPIPVVKEKTENEITITKRDFTEVIAEVSAKVSKEHDPIVGITAMLVGLEFEKKLFSSDAPDA